MIMKEDNKEKEYFFLLYFDILKDIIFPEDIIFKSQENSTHCILSKKVELITGKDKLINVFKYSGVINSSLYF